MPTVYILTNPVMPNLIKIGCTDRAIEDRLKELSSASGVPVPFECFLAVEVANYEEVERALHQAFGDRRINLKREFFELSPDKAAAILRLLQNRNNPDVTPAQDVVESPEEQQALDRQKKRRSNFRFSLVGIKPGETLTSIWDDNIMCLVENDRDVKFRNESHSLSSSALVVANERGYRWTAIAGPDYWNYEGKLLSALRRELEEAAEAE